MMHAPGNDQVSPSPTDQVWANNNGELTRLLENIRERHMLALAHIEPSHHAAQTFLHDHPTRKRLQDIIERRQLNAIFQPIVNMHDAGIIGYEGLIRGPSDSPLHSPLMLFQAARNCDLALEIEYLSRAIVMESFAKLGIKGKLFLNVSPDALLMEGWQGGQTLRCIAESGLQPDQVVIELTEHSPSVEYSALREATAHYRDMGFEIAMDDLGEGFSSLRLWSELRPNFVKIDKHFTQNIHTDPVKLQFVRSIQEIARNCGCKVIAEGIETPAEMMTVKNLGVPFGQGYFFAHPQARPETRLLPEIAEKLQSVRQLTLSTPNHYLQTRTTVADLLRYSRVVAPETPNADVFEMFEQDPNLYAIPVVAQASPVGLIGRYSMIDRFARQFGKELYGHRPCATMMDPAPLIVERSVTLHELSGLILEMEPYHLSTGFIITDRGEYLGMGSGHDLLREITKMQITAARYANPLTHLPGNVPINEHIDALLASDTAFSACYVDLDHFKPYNDVYGFREGDEIIKLTSELLQANVDARQDFIGHIGGDDFIVLFRSADWELRCNNLLTQFADRVKQHYSAADILQGGIDAEDRQGNRVLYPITSLSIGAAWIDPACYGSHHEVAAAASAAKKQAKKSSGNTLFINRRRAPQ